MPSSPRCPRAGDFRRRGDPCSDSQIKTLEVFNLHRLSSARCVGTLGSPERFVESRKRDPVRTVRASANTGRLGSGIKAAYAGVLGTLRYRQQLDRAPVDAHHANLLEAELRKIRREELGSVMVTLNLRSAAGGEGCPTP